ncbi:flagellar assembly protein FliH [Enterobacteriaceae bacterium ESL0689]|nr:flagellar assembly protein FliH [Enterobacteriaceae bacterium ESL0689]
MYKPKQIDPQLWKPWSLKDLGAYQSPLPDDTLSVVPEQANNDIAAQADAEAKAKAKAEAEYQQQLATLRQQAQQQGYSEGQQQGYDAGFEAGRQEGHQQGLLEAQQQQQSITERWQQLVDDFQQTLDSLDSVIVSRLMQLALTAAKQVLGQPAVCDGTALIAQIQQFIQQEPMLNGHPQLRVSPEDYTRVEQQLGNTLSMHGWRLLADGELHPGGCKISAEEGDLDASLATRWRELCHLVAPGEV